MDDVRPAINPYSAPEAPIVCSDGGPAGLGRTFGIRYPLTTLLGFAPPFSRMAVRFVVADDRRCLHDHRADTIVVDV